MKETRNQNSVLFFELKIICNKVGLREKFQRTKEKLISNKVTIFVRIEIASLCSHGMLKF